MLVKKERYGFHEASAGRNRSAHALIDQRIPGRESTQLSADYQE